MSLSLSFIKEKFSTVSFDGRTEVENLYEDSYFTRLKDGIELSELTSTECERLNVGQPFASWGGVRLDRSRCFYRLPNGNILMNSTIQRFLGTYATPHQLLATYIQCPSGQVKNFLNACRATVSAEGDSINVLVIGSKMSEGGGLWHKYFALFLSRQFGLVNIDFVDFSEKEDVWTTVIDGSRIKCQWVVGGVLFDKIPKGRYDVIIDDSWTMALGTVSRVLPSPLFSIKGHVDEVNGFVSYLHPTETRKFGSFPNSFLPSCSCLLCREIGNIVSSYEDYVLLRSFCSRLGHRSFCSGLNSSDLISLSGVKRLLLKLPTLPIHANKMVRLLTSLSEELDIVVEGIDISLGKKNQNLLLILVLKLIELL